MVMKIDARTIAGDLFRAENERSPIGALSGSYDGISLNDAYRIQGQYISMRLDRGERLIGRKVGLTSEAMQKLLQVDEHDFGCLTDAMRVNADGRVEMSKLIQPKVEAEIAFIMDSDIAGKDISIEEVKAAIRCVAPALEIIDSRIENWKIKLVDTVADNGSSALFVIGERKVRFDDIDLPNTRMRFIKNGNLIQEGSGSAVLGNPVNAVKWLIQTLADFGEGLREGDVVLPGALAAAVDAEAGDRFEADFDSLGTVSVNFIQ